MSNTALRRAWGTQVFHLLGDNGKCPSCELQTVRTSWFLRARHDAGQTVFECQNCQWAPRPDEMRRNPTAEYVLVALADEARDAKGLTCFPGLTRLAERTGLNERTIRSALQRLEEQGLISRRHRQRKNGSRTSDEYTLLMPESNRNEIPQANRNDDPDGPTSNRNLAPIQPESGSNPSGTTTRPLTQRETQRRNQRGNTARTFSAPIPADFRFSAEVREWARGQCPHVALDFSEQRFRNHYEAKGDKRVNWDAEARNWLLTDEKNAARDAPPPLRIFRASDFADDDTLTNTRP